MQVLKQFQSSAIENEKLLPSNKKVGGKDACILTLATNDLISTTKTKFSNKISLISTLVLYP